MLFGFVLKGYEFDADMQEMELTDDESAAGARDGKATKFASTGTTHAC